MSVSFVEQLIVGEATGAPQGLPIDSDADLEELLTTRLAGPFVLMDKADFQQMRNKLRASIGNISMDPVSVTYGPGLSVVFQMI
jgi:hypothetical protein